VPGRAKEARAIANERAIGKASVPMALPRRYGTGQHSHFRGVLSDLGCQFFGVLNGRQEHVHTTQADQTVFVSRFQRLKASRMALFQHLLARGWILSLLLVIVSASPLALQSRQEPLADILPPTERFGLCNALTLTNWGVNSMPSRVSQCGVINTFRHSKD
jgi:hypothetical protein